MLLVSKVMFNRFLLKKITCGLILHFVVYFDGIWVCSSRGIQRLTFAELLLVFWQMGFASPGISDIIS